MDNNALDQGALTEEKPQCHSDSRGQSCFTAGHYWRAQSGTSLCWALKSALWPILDTERPPGVSTPCFASFAFSFRNIRYYLLGIYSVPVLYINCLSSSSNPAKWYHEPHLQSSEVQGVYESGIFLLLKEKTQTQNDLSRVFISSHNQKTQAYDGYQAQLDLCAHVNHQGHVSLTFLSLPLVPIPLAGRLFLLGVRRWPRQPNMLHFIKCGSCGGAVWISPLKAVAIQLQGDRLWCTTFRIHAFPSQLPGND